MNMKIVNIEEIHEDLSLYDIETENHNFYANDILVHNSNGSVCFSVPTGFWVQSKENIITPESDNAGCAFFAYQNQKHWINIIEKLAGTYNIDLDRNIITIYYEWGGQGIQKNTALDGVEKLSMIFEYFKVSPLVHSETNSVWYPTNRIDCTQARIFNIMNFPTYNIEIDFEKPLYYQNKLIQIVENIIEPASPVGKQFGMESNIGEGIVVSFMYKESLQLFKVKGTKHSKTKVKTLKPVDDVKQQKIQDVAQLVTPAWRLEQMYMLANNILNGDIPCIENLGKFMKMVNQDIIKEESDVISEAGLIPKEIFGSVATIAREWYKDQLNTDLLG